MSHQIHHQSIKQGETIVVSNPLFQNKSLLLLGMKMIVLTSRFAIFFV